MAFKPVLRQRAVFPVVAAVMASGVAFSSPRQLHAEEPVLDASDLSFHNRKPIYDDLPLDTSAPAPASPTPAQTTTPTSTIASVLSSVTSSATPETHHRPTPTDRLAIQIGHARLALYQQTIKAEDALNNTLTRALHLEHSFTSTIRSLAPPKESGEKIFPGALYVLVSTMAGSIVTRNRNILLRATVPTAIGVTAAYAVLPITMRNVGDLAWTYEKRYPVLADAHLRTRERVTQFWETGKAHTRMTVGMVQDKLHDTRENLEGWVRKGK